MPKVKYPIPACEYNTDDLDAMIVAVLITMHLMIHNAAIPAKVEKGKQPTTTSADTSEDWIYFHSRWEDYKEATKNVGKELIVQLLRCCDDSLHKDLARS